MLRMPQRLSGKRPSAALVLSAMALTVAMGGTSYAAATIGTGDIKNNAITSPKIRDGAIRMADLAPNLRSTVTKPGPRGPAGPAGAPGAPGAPGTDGADGADGIGRWLLVDRNGVIVAQSGGFSIRTAYDQVNNSGAAVPAGAVGNVYIDANENLSNNAIAVSIAPVNQYSLDANVGDGSMPTSGNAGRNAGPDANPEFSGEITASVCGIANVVACAPTGANTRNTFVVSPRNSDGSFTQTGAAADPANPNTHKRFYVVITGDSSDYVAPTPDVPPLALP